MSPGVAGPTSSPAVCPYCSVVLPRRPQRKSRCKACREFIFVKTHPDTRERVLATERQAEVIEAAWTARHERRAAEQAVQRFGLSLDQFRERRAAQPDCSVRDLIWGMFNESLHGLMRAGDLSGLKTRYYEMALFCAEEDRPFTHLLEQSHEMELRSYLRSQVVSRVEVITAGEGNSCPACLRLHGEVFGVMEALQTKPLPCRACTTVVVGSKPGFCRCCYVAVVD
jgi:hypothetical protein